MKRWMIVLSWWAQEFLDKPRRDHLMTDPACEHYRAPREGSRLDRMSRGLECEPCMVRRAFGGDPCLWGTTQPNRDGGVAAVQPDGQVTRAAATSGSSRSDGEMR